MGHIHSLSKGRRIYLPVFFAAIFIHFQPSAMAGVDPMLYLDGSTLMICWSATGDDGLNGKAAGYDLRYSMAPPGADTAAWWEQCQQVTDEPEPAWPGERQCYTIENIQEGSQYYFAIKVFDEAGNTSAISNIASTIYDYHACADVDGDGFFSILDMIYMIQAIFKEGPPIAEGTGDVDNDGRVNVLDIIYLIRYQHMDGPAPLCP